MEEHSRQREEPSNSPKTEGQLECQDCKEGSKSSSCGGFRVKCQEMSSERKGDQQGPYEAQCGLL